MQRGKSNYSIGEISKITNLNKKTLRFYDEKGILKPSGRVEDNNYRYYSEQQILVALMIREMKHRGFTLAEMRDFFQSQDLTSFKVNLENKIADMQKEIEHMQKQLLYTCDTHNRINNVLSVLNKDTKKEDTITISTMPETTVLFTRYRCRVNAKELFWDRYAEIQNLRDQEKKLSSGSFTAIFHDHYLNQFLFDDGDLEVILPIDNGDLTKPYIKKFGGFLVASKNFVGPYYDLLQTYVELVKLIEEKNYEIIGPAIEEYLVEFSYGVGEEEYVTKVSFPIKKCNNNKRN